MRTGHSDISAPRALVLKPTQIRAGTAHAGAEASRIPHRHVGVWHAVVGVDRAFVCARALCHCVGNHRTLIVEDSRVLRVCDSDHPCGQVHGRAAHRLSEQQRRWVRRREPLSARAQRGSRSEGASKRASAQREEGEGGTHAHAGAQVRRLVGRAVCEAVRRQALAPVHVPWYVQHTTCCNTVQQGQAARQQALAPAHVCAPSVTHGVLCRNMLNYFATCCTTAGPPACFLTMSNVPVLYT